MKLAAACREKKGCTILKAHVAETKSKQTQELFNLIEMASNSEMNLLLVKILECKKFDKVDDVSRV